MVQMGAMVNSCLGALLGSRGWPSEKSFLNLVGSEIDSGLGVPETVPIRTILL